MSKETANAVAAANLALGMGWVEGKGLLDLSDVLSEYWNHEAHAAVLNHATRAGIVFG